MNRTDARAVGLYAVAARDIEDFLEMVPKEPVEVLELLYDMLISTNPTASQDDKELNALVAPLVKPILDRKRAGVS